MSVRPVQHRPRSAHAPPVRRAGPRTGSYASSPEERGEDPLLRGAGLVGPGADPVQTRWAPVTNETP